MNDWDAGFLFNRLLRGWWLLALGMLLGGAAGWGFSQVQPPVYEAVAFFQVGADESALLERFGLASPDELDFQKVNTLLQPVEDLFFAPDIRAQVLAELAAAGIPPEDGELDDQTFILDRRGPTWLVTVRDRDPDRAVRTADIWLETVANRLEEFQSHAVNAEILRVQYSLVAACFSGSTFPDANLCAGTALASQSELDGLLSALADQMAAEQADARGVDVLLSFGIQRLAEASPAPMLYARSNLIVAGSLAGLLLALLLVFLRKGAAQTRQ